MSTVKYQTARKIWKTQLPVDYIDNSLVQNAWETVSADLSGGDPVKFWWILMEQTNDGAAVEDVELEMTLAHPVTGVMTPYTVTFAGIASGVRRYVSVSSALVGGDFSFTDPGAVRLVGSSLSSGAAHHFTAASVGLIRVRQTTAVDGVAAQIEVNIVWDKKVDA